MDIKEKILEIMESNKKFVKDFKVERILKRLKVNTISEGIDECKSRIKENNYSVPLNWHGNIRMYYHVRDNNLFITNGESKFSFYSKDVYKYEFENEIEELRILFDIAGGLSIQEKLEGNI